jgi:CRISPR/Cas system-associated exonuclease Cas4 (RecB family)
MKVDELGYVIIEHFPFPYKVQIEDTNEDCDPMGTFRVYFINKFPFSKDIQLSFRKYLYEKLGFQFNNKFLQKTFHKIERDAAYKLRKELWSKNKKSWQYPTWQGEDDWIKSSVASNPEVEDMKLRAEFLFLFNSINTLKIYNEYRRKSPLEIVCNRRISASDISSFSFCPVSYAISKSYNIIPTPKSETGTIFHEQTRLVKRYNLQTDKYKKIKPHGNFINENNKLFFDNINSSELIYSGHSEKEKRRDFINKNFVCQPDYIFQNSAGEYYVVEEKFRHDSEDDDIFFKNHNLQLASYMYGIDEKEYKIAYGYLLYWKYIIDDLFDENGDEVYDEDGNIKKGPRVKRCIVKRINKDGNIEDELHLTGKEISHFNSTKELYFDKKQLNINKCNKCSVAGICRHKNQQFDDLKLPYYDGNYNKLHEVVLPTDLEKYETQIDNYFSR